MGTLRFAHPTMSTDQGAINGYFHSLSGVGASGDAPASRPATLGRRFKPRAAGAAARHSHAGAWERGGEWERGAARGRGAGWVGCGPGGEAGVVWADGRLLKSDIGSFLCGSAVVQVCRALGVAAWTGDGGDGARRWLFVEAGAGRLGVAGPRAGIRGVLGVRYGKKREKILVLRCHPGRGPR
jgi:hypothetical protein